MRELQEEANVRHGRRSVPARALGDARGRDSPLRHALLPGAHARRAGAEARRGRDDGARLVSPTEAIARFERRELLLPPPTWTTMRQLRNERRSTMCWPGREREPIVRMMPGFLKTRHGFMLTLPGDPLFPAIPGWEVPEETRFVLEEGAGWQPLRPDRRASISVIASLQRAKAGPAGRLVRSPDAVSAERRAVRDHARPATDRSAGPDARARSGRISVCRQGAAARDPDARWSAARSPARRVEPTWLIELWLSGTLRGTDRAGEAVVPVTLMSSAAGARRAARRRSRRPQVVRSGVADCENPSGALSFRDRRSSRAGDVYASARSSLVAAVRAAIGAIRCSLASRAAGRGRHRAQSALEDRDGMDAGSLAGSFSS